MQNGGIAAFDEKVAVYLLWIVVVIGFIVRDMSNPAYPPVMTMLPGAGAVRALRARTRSGTVQPLH